MDKQHMMDTAAATILDDTKVNLTILISQMWVILCGLQFAARHPRLEGPLRKSMVDVGKQFQAIIVKVHPEINALIELGWDLNSKD